LEVELFIGQERFRTLTSAYYRGAQGIILVYDVTRADTFKNVTEWLKEVDIYSTHENAVKMLVANKIDQEQNRVISKEQGRQFAKEHSMLYIETSAKTQQGIQQAFEELVMKILDIPELIGEADKKESVDVNDNGQQSSGCIAYCSI
jgi:Ras-related protein Rab-18